MAKSLVIVESPAKARTINKFLGKDFVVKASMGHVRDLPKRELGVDIEHRFEPKYIIIRGKGKILQEIKKAAARAEKIFLAPDHDREGEAIAYHLEKYLSQSNGNGAEIRRILFNEITEKAIREAIENPVGIDRQKVDAQQARRILDRLVGYLISPLLWKAIYRGTSAGRVQSVALRIICEREEEIEKFIPEEFWSIDGTFTGAAKQPFEASLFEIDGEKAKVTDGESAAAIAGELAELDFTVTRVEKKVRRRKPSPPFITSTLQQEAAKRFMFSARKTMQIAQGLYEGVEIDGDPVGLITYMRTDSTRIADEAIEEVRAYIQTAFGAGDLPAKPNLYKKKKGAQDAHEAIRPTSVLRTPGELKGKLTRDQSRVYELIWSRFVASQMNPAVYDQTAVDITGGKYLFRANGSVMRSLGYLKAFQEAPDARKGGDGKDRLLPVIEKGEAARLDEVRKDQHFTQPPSRYTDASLVKELEANGIGRPSTYASITTTLIQRKYIEREKQRFHPTRLGRDVLKFLLVGFQNVFNVSFTARMEAELDKIEDGRDNWRDVVEQFYNRFREDLDTIDEKAAEVKAELQKTTDILCEKCGNPMKERWGRNGKFLACTSYPECKHTRPLEGEEPEPTGEKCSECGGDMVIKSGRFGRFLACSRYPECRSTRSIPVGVKCPREECDGELTEKRTRGGKTFYGCSGYPDCKFALWNRPVNEKCPACGFPVMVEKQTKARGAFLECADSKCRAKKELSGETV